MQEREHDNRQETEPEMRHGSIRVAHKAIRMSRPSEPAQEQTVPGSSIAAFDWIGSSSQNFAEVAHDARNMVTALGLYCDLLEEPGVLSPSFQHYGSELKLLASASSRLVEKLMALNAPQPQEPPAPRGQRTNPWERMLREQQTAALEPVSGTHIRDLAFELETNRNLLGALVGPGIEFRVHIEGGRLPVRMCSEDLTRILVNLVRNAVEAMQPSGRLHIDLRELEVAPGADPVLLLSVEDNGHGVTPDMLERIFEPGYTTRVRTCERRTWQGQHLGLGLSITRSIVEAAGGQIHAAARDPSGLCFQIELPVCTN
jgi:signal transduction histidine kinase